MSPRSLPPHSVAIAVLVVWPIACGGSAPGSASTSGAAPASSPVPAPTASVSSGPSCASGTSGVCRIADAGVVQMPISRLGANGLSIDAETGRVFVVINGETNVWCGDRGRAEPGLSIVDPALGREVAIVPTGEGPVWPLVDPVRRKVFVASSAGVGSVVVHDKTTGARERVITLGGKPHDMGLDPLGSLMLVSNTADSSQTWVSVVNVDTGSVVSTIRVPELPHKVAVDEARRTGYVVSLGAGEVTAVDLTTGARLRSFSSGPIPQTSAMSFSPAKGLLFVGKTAGATPSGGSTVVAIDPASGAVTASAGTFTPWSPAGTRPWGGFGLDDANGLLFAAMGNSNDVAVIDIATMRPLGLFEVGACPWAVALDLPRGAGYVTSNQSATLSRFSLAKVRAALGR